MGNFARRMIINVLGAPLIVLCIYLGNYYLLSLTLIISFFAQYEFYRLSNKKGYEPISNYAIAMGLLFIITVYYFNGIIYLILTFIIVFLIVISFLSRIEKAFENASLTLFGFFYIPFTLSFLIIIRDSLWKNAESWIILLIMVLAIWSCDSLAYVVGKLIGRHKLAPEVSPNKTIEGGIAGLIGSILLLLVFYFTGKIHIGLAGAIIIGSIIGVFAQIGDLFESVLKRSVGVKDSGRLLLSHGGFLDRFDAFFIVTPIYYLFLRLMLLVQ